MSKKEKLDQIYEIKTQVSSIKKSVWKLIEPLRAHFSFDAPALQHANKAADHLRELEKILIIDIHDKEESL